MRTTGELHGTYAIENDLSTIGEGYLSIKDYLIRDGANAVYPDLNNIAILQKIRRLHEKTNTRWRSGHDKRSSPQRCPSAQMFDDLSYLPDHVAGRRLLTSLAIDFRVVGEILWIRHHCRRCDAWTDWSELVEGFCVAELSTRSIGQES